MPGEFPPSSAVDPTQAAAQAEQAEAVVRDAAYYLDKYGLGPEETQREVTSGLYSGTVAAMLDDDKCPVGRVVADAYEEGGIEAVDVKLKSLAAFAPDFELPISESTRGFHTGTLAREELFARTKLEPQPEKPDFLALEP